MATIGLDRMYFAPITEDSDGNETFGTPERLAKAMTVEMEIEVLEATLYADDGPAESVKEFGTGTITLGVDDIGVNTAEKLTGAQIDENHVVISQSEGGGKPVALGFRAKKSNNTYRYYWLYRVIFGIPATNLTTKGEEITFSTPTIEGTILRRNRLDGNGRHPWKAEVNEDDTSVPRSTITGWYSQVYEPSFPATPTISITTQPQDASVTAGAITGELSVTAAASSGTLSYQWYRNTVNSTTGGTAVSGATSAALTIPTDLTEGSYYFYCELTAGATTQKTTVAAVTVAA
jgi:phi13 family phage major tail protein